VTTADWKIDPQKTRGKTANRAARVFIADFYSGNIARVHFSVRFYLFKFSSRYSLFFQYSICVSHFLRMKNARSCNFYSRFVCAITRFSAQIQRKPHQVSVFSA
jgi:hypothetical protein